MTHVIFTHAQEESRAAMLAGEPMEVFDSEYGGNEHFIEFLRESGLWDILVSWKPSVLKGNGKDPAALNGAWVICDLAHIGQLQYADPLLKDGHLAVEMGFTVKEIQRAQGAGKGVVHRDTLRNLIKRVEPEEALRVWGDHLEFLRQKRLIRGKIYAVDGFDLEVTGKRYEGMGKKWDGQRWIQGYKVVMLLNVAAGRERIVGLALGPIEADERKLVVELLTNLRRLGIEPKEVIDLLIMDRGYWGAAFFETLTKGWGLNFLTLARSDLAVVTETKALLETEGHPFHRRIIKRASGKEQELEIVGVEGIVISDERGNHQTTVNTVLARDVDQDTGEIRERVFVTSLPTAKFPHRAVELYGQRWEIENQGIREFSQRWRARVPIGRKRNAIWAQLHMLAMLYNAVHIYEMKRPKDAAELRQECRRRARRSYLAGKAILVFIPGRRIYMAISVREFENLVRERTTKETLNRVRQLLNDGYSLEEALTKAGK